LNDSSIASNIAFGVSEYNINYTRVDEVLKSVNLYKFVHNLPKKTETVVGERGAKLSGGQKQRISIARALYCKPSLLILDEATSSLDEHTENGIIKEIFALDNDLTIVMISHKLSILSGCKHIYKVIDGNIKEITNI
jgi:ABC-type multidrug transport system fused ATPase/permease subunit